MVLLAKTPELEFAIATVRQATRLAKEVQTETVSPALTKEDRSPVTVADFTVQAVVAHALAQSFPADPLVAEESAAALRAPAGEERLEQVTHYVRRLIPKETAEGVCAWIDRGAAEYSRRCWVLDPIDGTKGFLRGGQYAVALALLVDGQVNIGVLGCPNLRQGKIEDYESSGSLMLAVRGHGSYISTLADDDGVFEQVHVSTCSDPTQARLLRSVEAGHTNMAKIDQLAQHLGIQTDAVQMDSQAKYAILASGGGDVAIRLLPPQEQDYRERIWDQAAGSLIVAEAGGQISDLSGRPFDFTAGRLLSRNRGVLATNGLLHPIFLQALAEIGA